MSRTCALCGKGSVRANHVSHSKRRVPRLQSPNLQQIKVEGLAIKTCSSCRRTLVKKVK